MEIRSFKEENLKGSFMLIGFPSRGLVGGVAANFVIDELKMWHVASLYDARLPPTMLITDGVGDSPIRFFVSAESCGPDGKCDKLVVCMSEVPFDQALLGEVAHTIVGWAKGQGVAHIVVLEGVESTTPGGKVMNGKGAESAIRGVKSLMSKVKLERLKVPIVKEGVVSGYGSAFLLAANAVGMDLVALFAEARADLPDARAATMLLRRVDPMLPHINFQDQHLERRARQLETDLKQTIRSSGKQLAQMRRANEMMYQ